MSKSIDDQINQLLPLVDHATNAEISIALHGLLLEREHIVKEEIASELTYIANAPGSHLLLRDYIGKLNNER